ALFTLCHSDCISCTDPCSSAMRACSEEVQPIVLSSYHNFNFNFNLNLPPMSRYCSSNQPIADLPTLLFACDAINFMLHAIKLLAKLSPKARLSRCFWCRLRQCYCVAAFVSHDHCIMEGKRKKAQKTPREEGAEPPKAPVSK